MNNSITQFEKLQSGLVALASTGEDAIIKIVDYLLKEAVNVNASDIHLEPGHDKILVKFRIDGVLHSVAQLPKTVEESLMGRLKIVANLVTYKKRLPQDGRIEFVHDNKTNDLRISFMPVVHGEKVVIRFINSGQYNRIVDELGFLPEMLDRFKQLLEKPHGTLILTGPAGCGKTTTIYASLRYIYDTRNGQVNIMTIEDPVESYLDNINQSQINPVSGITFSSGLRAVLRQDPDVIMIGEVRDKETADIAIQAGLTGHLVVSTVHAASSLGVFARLLNLGMEPYLIASSIIGIISQRLVRIACPECRTKYQPDKKIVGKLPKSVVPAGFGFEKSIGCEKCNMTGFIGRTGVFELVAVDDQIRELILKKESIQKIEKVVRKKGMVSLAGDAIKKMLNKTTTIEEIVRIM
jgi:type IV pilus assembly protein PilB